MKIKYRSLVLNRGIGILGSILSSIAISTTANPPYVSPIAVNWQLSNANIIITSAASGSLQKTSTSSAAWNTGAISNKGILRDGYVQFKAVPGSQARLGLSLVSTSDGGIDYAIEVKPSGTSTTVGTAQVVLNGSAPANNALNPNDAQLGNYDLGTTFTISRFGSIITFHNSSNGYSRSYESKSTSRLLVDCSLYKPSSAIAEAKVYIDDADNDGMPDSWEGSYLPPLHDLNSIQAFKPEWDIDNDGVSNLEEFVSGTSASEPLSQTEIAAWPTGGSTALTLNPGGIKKQTPGTTATYNAKAIATNVIEEDGQYVFRITPGTITTVGLNTTNTTSASTDVESAIITAVNGGFVIRHNGTTFTLADPLDNYTADTVFAIRRTAGYIQFFKDGTEVVVPATSLRSSGPLYPNVWLSSPTAELTMARIDDGNIDNDELPDVWERAFLPPNSGLSNLSGFSMAGNADFSIAGIADNSSGFNRDQIENGDEFLGGTSPVDSLSRAEVVDWIDRVNIEAITNNTSGGLQKNNSAGYTSHALGNKSIQEDGVATFQVSSSGVMTFGLNTTNDSSVSTDMEWAFITTATGTYTIKPNRAAISPPTGFGNFTHKTRFAIQRVAGVVRFLKDDVVVHTEDAAVNSAGPLYPNVWISTPAMKLTMARCYTGDLDNDNMPDAWELTHLQEGAGYAALSAFEASGAPGSPGDPDGDGISNLEEYYEGTSPHHPLLQPAYASWQTAPANTLTLGAKGNVKKNGTAATAGWYSDAVAVGTVGLTGSIAFSALPESTLAVGFTLNNGSRTQNDLEYMIQLTATGNKANVYELSGTSAVLKAALGDYNASTRFSIRRVASRIDYYKDGQLYYSSTVPVTALELLVDSSFNNLNSEITSARVNTGDVDGDYMPDEWEIENLKRRNAANPDYVLNFTQLNEFEGDDDSDSDLESNIQEYYSGTDPIQQTSVSHPVVWENSSLTGTTTGAIGGLTKTTGTTAGFNAGAHGGYLVGDGVVSFSVSSLGKFAFGLTYSDDAATDADLEFAFVLSATDAKVQCPEETTDLSVGAYTADTVFTIRRLGSVVEFLKNGIVVHTSTTASQGDLYVDCSIYTPGEQISMAKIGDLESDDDGIPDSWEMQYISSNPTSYTNFTFQELSTFSPSSDNFDNDGVNNYDEYLHGTSPRLADSDGDGMSDRWEIDYALAAADPSNASSDSDNDGRTNLTEFQTGTNPRDADTDHDGLNDNDEAPHQTNPLIADTDLDKIPDGYEVAHQLSPTNPADGLADADGDRIPNVWEYFRGFDINDKDSKPDFDATVNPALVSSDYATKQFKTLKEASDYVGTVGPWMIIFCKRGIHFHNGGSYGRLSLSYNTAVAWIGEKSGNQTSASSTTTWKVGSGVNIRNTTVIDGITIESGQVVGVSSACPAISTNLFFPNNQTRFVNSIIKNYHSTKLDAQSNIVAGALYNVGADIWFINSTIISCATWQSSSSNLSNAGPAIYNASGKVHLINSVIWDNFYSPAGSTLMNNATAPPVEVTTSVVQGVNNDPHLNPFGLLTSDSGNCILAGTAGHVLTDIHGELRNAQSPSIGAHEWVDSDSDNLPDQWEKFWLNDSLVPAIQATYADNDGLDLDTEYLLGTKPTVEDTDSDGLNDGWENQNKTNPLAQDSLADPDGDLMTNAQEYALRNHGLKADDETDGFSDIDGDSVPNAWETAETAADGANWPPTSAIVKPSPAAGQTPPQFATLQAAYNHVTTTGATDDKMIIRVHPGIYEAILTYHADATKRRRIAWLAEPKAEILGGYEGVVLRQLSGSGGRLNFNTDSYVNGFVIEGRSGVKSNYPAISVVPVSGSRPQVRLVNTIIRNWNRQLTTSQESADSSDIGGAIDNKGAKVFLAHCTLWRSAARTSTGAPLSTLNNRVLANSPSKFTIHNLIVWDDSAGDHTLPAVGGDAGAEALIAGTGSNILQGVTAQPPQLSVDGCLTANSPARSAGVYHHSSPAYDIHFFARSSTGADIGAMQWSSASYKLIGSNVSYMSDSDILPDWWELWRFGDLSHDGTLGLEDDTLTDEQELRWGTDPSLGDTDGDGLSDNAEILVRGTNPISSDSDNDGMPDNWELTNGSDPMLADGSSDLDGDLLTILQEFLLDLSPNDETDGFSDKDGDSLPNAWDYNNTGVVAIVTPNPISGQWPEQFASIQAAYDYVSSLYWVPHNLLPIIEVTPGVYDASLVTNPDPNKRRRIAWIAKPKAGIHGGVEGVVLRLPASGIGGLQFNTDTYMDGFIIEGRRGVVPVSPAVRITPLSGIPQVRLVNTLIRNWNRALTSTQENADSFDTGGAIDNQGAKVFLAHCTLWRSAARSSTGAPLRTLNNRALVNSPSKFTIHNSIVWDDLAGDHTLPATGGDTGAVTASSSNILQGVTAQPPQLSMDGLLTSSSPARGAGIAHHSSPVFDIHFFARSPLGLDIGAMEWSSDGYKLANSSPSNTPDNDVLPDWWELWRFNSLTRDGTLDFEGDSLKDTWEFLMGTDPTIADSDGDGINDGVEDFDGDRVPNIYEYANNTDPASITSQPTPHAIVDPPNAEASTTDNIFATIQEAVGYVPTTASQPEAYYVVRVKSGSYAENVSIDDRRLLLMSDVAGGNPVIAPSANGDAALTFSGNSGGSMVRDFTLSGQSRAASSSNRGILVDLGTSTSKVRVTDCIIIGHNSNSSAGAGIYVDYGKLEMVHCTLYNNVTTGQGRSLYVDSSSTTSATVTNCILWSAGTVLGSEIQGPGLATVTGSLLKTSGTADPMLDIRGFLTPQSVSPRGNGVASYVTKVDIQGETRGTLPDRGADQYQNNDNDGLPDWWERQVIGNLASDGSSNLDNDTLINELEYAFESDPLVGDTDGDGALDSAEYVAQSNPRITDTDGDSMLDGYEIQHGLEPLNYRDTLADKDGDRIPNIYEFKRGTLPEDADSKPPYDMIVDSSLSNSSTTKTTIAAALSAVSGISSYPIIFVKYGSTGVYPEKITLEGQRALLLGEAGTIPPTVGVDNNDESVRLYTIGDSVLDGFIITHTDSDAVETGVFVKLDSAKKQARLVNCIITGNALDNGAGIYLQRGELTVAHCTVFGNRRDDIDPEAILGIHIFSEATLLLQNSIVWNDDGLPGGQQITLDSGGSITVTNSIIRGGLHGGLNVNPLLDSGGRLMVGSPAINPAAAVVLAVSTKDIHNEARDSIPDIGADEFYDSDLDTLPDRWELLVFGNLSHTASGHADTDGLSNVGEYVAGSNPLVDDTDGDGISDLTEAVTAAGTTYYYAGALATDGDGDGLTLAQEQLLGTNPDAADSNGDGIADGAAWSMGLSVTGNDSDSDGLPTSAELAQGTSPILADTDGDGVSDLLDAFPLDPSESSLTSGDVTAPLVVLTKPVDAVPLP